MSFHPLPNESTLISWWTKYKTYPKTSSIIFWAIIASSSVSNMISSSTSHLCLPQSFPVWYLKKIGSQGLQKERSISDCHSHETVKLWGDGDFNVFILLLFLLNWLKLEVFFVFRLAFTFSAWGYCVQVGAYRGDLNIISLVDHLQRRLPWGKEKFSFGIAKMGEGIFSTFSSSAFLVNKMGLFFPKCQ